MVEIISGRAGSGKTAYCLERIKNELTAEPAGRAIILLLPEHMTYKVERQLASMLSKEGRGFSRCYVYGFRRFAYQVLQEVGGGLEKGLDELGRSLLLRQLVDRRLQDGTLSAFARAGRQRGFVGELGDIINEMKTFCLSPEQLLEISAQVGRHDLRLRDKLKDMALLYGDFNEAMAGKYSDGKDVLSRLAERLPKSEIVRGAELWLDGFLFFNPLEKQILWQLFQLCEDVHVTLTLDNSRLIMGQPWQDVPREDVFFRSQNTRNYLLETGRELGMSVTERFLSEGVRYTSQVLKEAEAQWMSHRLRAVEEKFLAGQLKVTEAATIRLELEAMAADIVKQVRENGYTWSDIGILIRDEEAYNNMAMMVLQEYNIPFFSAAKRKINHHPLAELLRSALVICTSGGRGWNYENVFRCLKTGFFKEACGLLPDALDELENYVLEFGIRGQSTWSQGAPWDYVSRYGFEDEEIDEKQQLRSQLADSRRRLAAAPVLKLQKALENGRDISALAGAVYDFLLELHVPEQLEAWSSDDEAKGNLAAAREHQQIWQGVMALLDQVVELGIQSQEGMLSEFAAVVEEGLENMSVSLIPPGLDYVSLASFDQNSLDNTRAIYIVGANAGVMPRHSSENVILSDADRIYINQVEGIRNDSRLSVIGQENSYNEAYLLYKGFTQAREYLWVSYALSDDNGTGREPARLLQWLRRLVPHIRLNQVLQGDSFVAEGRQSLSVLGAALRYCKDYGVMDEDMQAVYNWLLAEGSKAKGVQRENLVSGLGHLQKALSSRMGADRLPGEIAGELFAPKGYLRGSVTRLEMYNRCPFQYFSQYGLRLQERKIRKFSSMDLGNLLHGVLQEFGEQLKAENRRWSDVSEAEQESMCHEILHRLAPKLQNNILFQQKQLEVQLSRIENTAVFAIRRLCALDEVSKLHPEFFEQAFGFLGSDENEKALSLVYNLSNHKKLSLSGKIDRIDMTEDGRYFMVIDYKTGTASINIMDVYYGVKLQLLTYLLVANQMMARLKGEKAVPIGMLYYFLKKPVVSLPSHKDSEAEVIDALEKKLLMPGWVVADKELVKLIDSSLSPGGKSQFIHASLKKDGELGKADSYLRDEREFELLLEYVERLLQKTGEDIMGGKIAPEPYKGGSGKATCTYCAYHPICGFDAQLEGFGYKNVLKQKDIEFIRNIEEDLSKREMGGNNGVDR